MRVYNVVYRDDTNNEVTCIGSFVNPDKARTRLEEKVEEVKKDVTEGGGDINEITRRNENEVSVNYNESYVDLIVIVENEVE